MTLTNKQHELLDELLTIIRLKFPGTGSLSMNTSPEKSDNDVWVKARK